MTLTRRSALVLVVAGFWSTVSEAAFVVKNTKDSGPGSLREAILRANLAPGPETITFSISGKLPHTITPKSPLPAITNTVAIEAPKKHEIVLDGSNLGYSAGLELLGTGSSVTSLVVNGGWECGIRLAGGGYHRLDRNRIGTDAAGVTAVPNFVGVCVESSNNQIGVGGRNVISGNTHSGVFMHQATLNLVQGNYIGPGASGQSLTPGSSPQQFGVSISGNRNTLTGNLITGATFAVSVGSSSNVIEANKICTTADGTAPPEESGWGIWPGWGIFLAYADAVNNVIGSTVPGRENVIAHCVSGGVLVVDSKGNSIRGNRIYGIGAREQRMAIDLAPAFGPDPNDPLDVDSGANDLQNKPTIVDALFNGVNSIFVVGLLQGQPFSSYVADVYASPVDPGNGSCETQSYLGSTSFTTDAGGQATFFLSSLVAVPFAGQFVSATATALTGSANTSEVSACRAVRAP
jgi:hypothetical protein